MTIRKYGFYRFTNKMRYIGGSYITPAQAFYNILHTRGWEKNAFQVLEMDGCLVTKVAVGGMEIHCDYLTPNCYDKNYLFGEYSLTSGQMTTYGFFPGATYRLDDYEGFVENSVINKRAAPLIKNRVVKARGEVGVLPHGGGKSTGFTWYENGEEKYYPITVTAFEAMAFFKEVDESEYTKELCMTVAVGYVSQPEDEYEETEAPEITAFPLTKITISNNEEAWSVYQMLKTHFKE
jgi:hypothetical protein